MVSSSAVGKSCKD